jgi:hypothetical protein
VLAVGLALASVSPSSASASSSVLPGVCTGAAPKTISHVVVIVMENKNESSIIGSSQAPYLNELAATCGQASNYHGVAHPSLPNYLALTGGSTFGVNDDKNPSAHKIAGTSIFAQLGSSWRSYQDGMTRPCQKAGAGPLYAVKHNPAAYYTSLNSCAANDLPLPANPSFDAAFTLVTPSLQHDMHDGTVSQGDRWVAAFVPRVLSSPQYQAGNLALFIVWDENDGPNHVAGNQVPLIAVAPSVRPGTVCAAPLDHYSLLATWETLLSVARLGKAAATAPALADFHL